MQAWDMLKVIVTPTPLKATLFANDIRDCACNGLISTFPKRNGVCVCVLGGMLPVCGVKHNQGLCAAPSPPQRLVVGGESKLGRGAVCVWCQARSGAVCMADLSSTS